MKYKYKTKTLIVLFIVAITCYKCTQSPKKTQKKGDTFKMIQRRVPSSVSYHFEKAHEWISTKVKTIDSAQLHIVLAVNRTDFANLRKMDSILVPDNLTGDIAYYLPFPLNVPYLKEVSKIIFFSYSTQTFGAYQNGQLIYTGPTNMGRKKDPTPIGLYYTNWKAEKIISTVDDEWELKWNFNIQNKEGIGWHQYNLPGYPASHSCLRLQEGDAKYLYVWANQWIVNKNDSVLVKGTPVVVFGTYNFDAIKPWLQVVKNPHVLDISAASLQQEIAPNLTQILAQQQKRESAASLDASK